MEIIYLSVQSLIYCSIVYWMCWFQRDAGKLKDGLLRPGWQPQKSGTDSLCLLHSTSRRYLPACPESS